MKADKMIINKFEKSASEDQKADEAVINKLAGVMDRATAEQRYREVVDKVMKNAEHEYVNLKTAMAQEAEESKK